MKRATFPIGAIASLIGLASGALPGDASAQLTDVRAGAGVRYESYSFSDPALVNLDAVTLLTMPVSARAWVGSRVELAVAAAYARGTLTRASGEESEIAGLVDTEVRLTTRFAGDRFRLGVVALLPTGTSELEAEELDAAGLIASDLLPFAISNWGTGGGIGLTAAVALPLNDATSLGISTGYVLGREYEPLADREFSYRPGNQLHVRAALDHMIGNSSKATLQLTYQQFSEDEGNGTSFYQTGDRLQALGTFAFAAGRSASAILYAGYLRRLEGEYINLSVPLTPAQDLVYAGGSLRAPFGGVILVPTVDLRVLGNDEGIDQGYTLSAGTGVELRAGGLELVPSARFRIGELTVRTAQESSYTGIDLGITLRNRTVTR